MPVPSTSSTKMAKWDQGNGPLKCINVTKLPNKLEKNRIDVKSFIKNINYTIFPYTFVIIFLLIRLIVVLFMDSLKTKLILSFKKTVSNFHNMQNSICYKGKSYVTNFKDYRIKELLNKFPYSLTPDLTEKRNYIHLKEISI